MNIAIIPARGGSKRIPRKNIRDFCGHPILKYSIDAAQRSCLFDKIIVTTDDAEITELAKSYNVEVPFSRPKHLSDDFAGTTAVVSHALKWLKVENRSLNS
jgi:N-acylneuraminate cytidylyltransferase